MRKTEKLRPWELAMLLALCVTFAAGMWADRRQEALTGGLVRLHVVAASDSPADQAEKLQLRDRVLALLSPLLADCTSQEDAVDIIAEHMDELRAMGDVTVTLDEEYYPTRRYSTFSLPAGRYASLRVTMGPGRGQNWWCVVFPPLCTEALAREEAGKDAFLTLDAESADLIAGTGREYDLRFRVVDWWGQLKEYLS